MAMSMEPRIVTLDEPIEVIGISMRSKVGSTHPEITQLWQRYMKEGISGRIPNKRSPSVYYGVSYDDDKSDRSFSYMAGEGVTTLEKLPEGLERHQIPAIKYVVFKVEAKTSDAFPEAITNAMRYIYDTWLPNSGHKRAEGVGEFELYEERSHRKENAEMDIYVPVK
jgi:AraC family transcriptional regulator